MASFTWHPDATSNLLTITVEWRDEKKKQHNSTVRLCLEAGEPTVLAVSANGRRLFEDTGTEERVIK